MAYQGKTNWTKDDIVKPDDLNRIEQGIEDAQSSIDNISQSLTPESIGAAKKTDFDVLVKNSVSIKTSTSKDFNTYREPGLYFIGSVSEYANAPSSDGGFSWGILRVETLGTTAYVAQSYTCIINNVTFTRSKAEDSTGRGWESWRATSKLDADGVLRLSKWLDIRGDAATINSYGKTHTYHAFLVNNDRVGYVGASDPNAPANMALVSDKADVVINAKNNVWLNASAGAVHLNGRNILWELDQVKQSVVDGKGQVAAVINGKGGGPVSANSTFPQLADGINKINTGAVLTASGEIRLGKNEIGYKEITMFTIPASVKDFSMYIMSSNDGITIQNFDSDKPEVYSRFYLKNPSGSIDLFVLSEHSGIERGTYNFNNFSFNKNTRTVLISGDAYRNSQNNIIQFSKEIPSNFDLNQDVKIMLSIETRVENWWEMHSVFRNMRAIMV